jgi:excisionase family DNA binding protein
VKDSSRFLSLKELASHLSISYNTAYRLAHSKDFPACKIGGVWRVDKVKLERWLAIQNEQKMYA